MLHPFWLPGAMSNDEKTGGKQTKQKQPAKQGKAFTAPKGRPTVHPVKGQRTRRLSSTVEWIIATVVFVAVLLIIFYVARDFRSETGSPLEQLAPIVAVALTGAA